MSNEKDPKEAKATPFDPGQFLQFMQQSWANAMPQAVGIPPGMTSGDLDKRIAELRVVEQWLDVNLTMLRTSLQALEVQRGTLAALQAFSEKLGEPSAREADAQDASAQMPAMAAFSKALQQMTDVSQASLMPWWQNLHQQFSTIASQAVGPHFAGVKTDPDDAAKPTEDRKPKRPADQG